VIAEIPLKFVGASKGVKDGGKLITKMKSLKVKTYPKYLKEQIEVNIDDLELNGNIRVEDVKVDHYEILNSPRIPIASVVLTRQLKQEEATTPAAGAAPAAAAALPPAVSCEREIHRGRATRSTRHYPSRQTRRPRRLPTLISD
jgi:large subunit ribosomal protein L25